MTRERIIDYYSGFDEWGRLEREPLEFIINMHYIRAHLPAAGLVLDNGAGPGKYAMELARDGYRVTLSDLTPASVDIARQKAKAYDLTKQFEGFHVLDATRLEGLADDTYDASLMLGPLYHLQTEQDRVAAVRELHRVTKRGSMVYIAMQSRMRMAINSLQSPSTGNRIIIWVPFVLLWKRGHSTIRIRADSQVRIILTFRIFNHSWSSTDSIR
ncbi:class I SAM-dependent methyltransferase [Paenibacillus illinoisensis]|uniref:class I SAM-dependent methyltransferase n=1 Tax=Paenibacillus illinoisensis TaxID=59845 RepID=UPI00267FE579|nr:class I SAM-dependent methyltransferase [Paenibacillus illinoisensis]